MYFIASKNTYKNYNRQLKQTTEPSNFFKITSQTIADFYAITLQSSDFSLIKFNKNLVIFFDFIIQRSFLFSLLPPTHENALLTKGATRNFLNVSAVCYILA